MSSRRAVLIDAAAVTTIAVAACAAASNTTLMSAVTALVFAARMAIWAYARREFAPPGRGRSLGFEAAFLGVCLVLGALNDWNTVVRHRVYSYGVPSDLLPWSTIPAWMLAYWGLILRFVATLGLHYGAAARPVRDTSALRDNPYFRIGLLLVMVVATRQSIYRLYLDPWLSWLPFAAALAVHALVLEWGPAERRLALLAAIVGPVAESALIQLGGLHHYALGWLGGVPVWIALWWVLAVLVWTELSRFVLGLFGALNHETDSTRSLLGYS
ncbi:MAG: hypothetical protein U0271_00950 [Polyangiaceae bacterium]